MHRVESLRTVLGYRFEQPPPEGPCVYFQDSASTLSKSSSPTQRDDDLILPAYIHQTLKDEHVTMPPDHNINTERVFDRQEVGTLKKAWFWKHAHREQRSTLHLLWDPATFESTLTLPIDKQHNVPRSSLTWKQLRLLLSQKFLMVWFGPIYSLCSLFTVVKRNGCLRPICNPKPVNSAIHTEQKLVLPQPLDILNCVVSYQFATLYDLCSWFS